MKRLAIYTMMVLVLGGMALTLAHRAQTQNVTEETVQPVNEAVPETTMGGSTSPVFSYQGQLLDAQGNPVTGNVPMIFRLYATATGGTACWTENHTNANAVDVQGGRFSVLLGSITPVGSTCTSAEALYLELIVNNETLSPRQLMADAWRSGTLISGATTQGPLHVGGRIYTRNGADIGMQDNGGGVISIANNPDDNKVYLEAFSADGTDSANEFLITGRFANPMPLLSLRADLTSISGDVGIGGWNISLGDVILRRDGRDLHLLPWGGAGRAYDRVCIGCGSTANLTVNGNLDVNGSCSASIEGDDVAGEGGTCTAVRITEDGIQTGAVIELNLMTPAEQTAGRIDRFTEGDLLCWSTQTERLETCNQANTRLVMAVANAKGLPIVQGAEPVKVIGPVMAGDTLVASATPGYAMVNNDALQGTTIGKALADFDGKAGVILVWIRP